MSNYTNPTALQVGTSGKLCGLNYRVIGRVVLGVDVDGETYYWNEYNLRDDSGQTATLVFEETENGPEWKLFILFEPVQPMTAAEAARYRVGGEVNLNGKPIKVTLVGQSRVYHIEGQAPEGVEVGDIANYFNADTGVEMEVASWTGDEIEFYRGIDVQVDDVASGFNLPVEKLTGGGLAVEETESSSGSSWPILPKLITVGVAALIGFAYYSASRKPSLTGGAPKKPQTRVSPLTTGASGTLATKHTTIAEHAIVEIAKAGALYDWHEYRLRDDAGESALLICGLTGDAAQWHLFRSARPFTSLTPPQAAALRVRETLMIGERTLRIETLFQARRPEGAVSFGFLARAGNDCGIVRWTQNEIEFYLGAPLPEKEVLAAFK